MSIIIMKRLCMRCCCLPCNVKLMVKHNKTIFNPWLSLSTWNLLYNTPKSEDKKPWKTKYQVPFVLVKREISSYKKEEKLVQEKIKKMLRTRTNLRKKFYDEVPEKTYKSQVPSTNSTQFGKLNRNIQLRDQTRANIVLREVQELIDSGMVADEVTRLQVRLTTCNMLSKQNCIMQWELQGTDRDVLIHDVLNKYAAEIRHILIHNHVIGHTPSIHFHVTEDVVMEAKVNKMFEAGLVDTGPPEEHDENYQEMEGNMQTDKIDLTLVPTYNMFGIDHVGLSSKILSNREENKRSFANVVNKTKS